MLNRLFPSDYIFFCRSYPFSSGSFSWRKTVVTSLITQWCFYCFGGFGNILYRQPYVTGFLELFSQDHQPAVHQMGCVEERIRPSLHSAFEDHSILESRDVGDNLKLEQPDLITSFDVSRLLTT